jgi:hypothetical protein
LNSVLRVVIKMGGNVLVGLISFVIVIDLMVVVVTDFPFLVVLLVDLVVFVVAGVRLVGRAAKAV